MGVAHMHAWGYANALVALDGAASSGVWDADPERAKLFAERFGLQAWDSPDQLLAASDAVVICSENTLHADYGETAARDGKHILCEKPLVTTEADGLRLIQAARAGGVKLMTAFPCRYAPSFVRLREQFERVENGRLVGICATNRGRCPFDWFVEKDKSGGGALIDHVVHVADLLRVLLGRDPIRVLAQTGNGIYGREFEDVAMVSLDYEDGLFATLDSSWSRPKAFKTWGDVTMHVVFEQVVYDIDLFAQHVDVYSNQDMRHTLAGYGSDLDRSLVRAFVECVRDDTVVPITGEDGLAATRVALAAMRSVETGQPEALAPMPAIA